MQLGQLQKIEENLVDLGYQILAVSPDRPEKLIESRNKNDLSYTLLSDADMEASKAFGLAFRVPDKTVETYRGYGIDLEESSGRDHQLLPVPAVFLVSEEGVVQFQYTNPNYQVRLQPELVLAAAKANREAEARP